MKGSRGGWWLALGVVALGAGCDLGRATSWIEGAPGRVAQDLAARLRKPPNDVGPVTASGTEVKVLGGKLRLRVRDARQRGDSPGTAHFQVIARISGDPTTRLEASVYGFGDSRKQAVATVAQVYLERAFPPVLAAVREDASTTVLRFGGSEPWAVPGFRGFMGGWTWWGEFDQGALFAALVRARPFAGISPAPTDGKPHLVKLLLVAKGDAWERTLEIDGDATNVSAEPWREVAPPAGARSLMRYAVIGKADAAGSGEARAQALRQLEARDAWLYSGEACPRAAVPEKLHWPPHMAGTCRGGRLLDCAEECKAGSASSCFAAARELEGPEDAQTPEVAVPLFRRACRLGHASGCTNAAAALGANRGKRDGLAEADDCPERTFELVCDRSADPWACFMLGRALAHGDHVGRDAKRARELLEAVCDDGDDEQACDAATAVLDELDAKAKPAGAKKPRAKQ
jgi:hypothetical protein